MHGFDFDKHSFAISRYADKEYIGDFIIFVTE